MIAVRYMFVVCGTRQPFAQCITLQLVAGTSLQILVRILLILLCIALLRQNVPSLILLMVCLLFVVINIFILVATDGSITTCSSTSRRPSLFCRPQSLVCISSLTRRRAALGFDQDFGVHAASRWRVWQSSSALLCECILHICVYARVLR